MFSTNWSDCTAGSTGAPGGSPTPTMLRCSAPTRNRRLLLQKRSSASRCRALCLVCSRLAITSRAQAPTPSGSCALACQAFNCSIWPAMRSDVACPEPGHQRAVEAALHLLVLPEAVQQQSSVRRRRRAADRCNRGDNPRTSKIGLPTTPPPPPGTRSRGTTPEVPSAAATIRLKTSRDLLQDAPIRGCTLR